jgi:DNA-binding SARP family transcriptional activator
METRWQIELLGGLRAVQGDRVVTRFRTRKAGALLAYLAYYPHRSHGRDELSHVLWPEARPDTARTNLRVALRLLRRQLEPGGEPAGTLLVADRASVQLNPDAIVTDVAEFQALLQSAKGSRRTPEAIEFLASAVEVYRGELLPGYFEDWVLQERQWLAECYFQALTGLLAHLERAGQFDRAVEYGRRGVIADPLREEAHRDLIRLLAAVDQPAAALRQYDELKRLLREQLGATPTAVTRALTHEIERLALLRLQPSSSSLIDGPRSVGSATQPALIGRDEPRLGTLLVVEARRCGKTTRALPPSVAGNRSASVPPEPLVLQAMVDVVLKYGGRIGGFQAGGVLAAFGVSRAREDDPERAIRAALEIREVARGLGWDVTAGVHTGEVDADALDDKMSIGMTAERLTLGRDSVIDLTVRLQRQAQPGQILVSEMTQYLTRRGFAFAPRTLGTPDLAGAFTTFAVERVLPRPEKARGIEGLRARLIGRERELEILQVALADVLQGRGQMVSLIGEAGVGKSRLIGELRAVASKLTSGQLSHPLWLEGRCLELGMTASYSLLVDLLRDYFGTRNDVEGSGPAEAVIAALHEFVARGDLSEERADEMGPLLGRLLSLRFDSEWDRRLKNADPEQIRHQTLLAMRDFFVALSRQQPLVLVLEDLHWADSLSLDLIALLMEALEQSPLLLVCLYRPEREHKCWHLATIASRKCPGQYAELSLRELSPAQSWQLLEALLTPDRLPDALTKEIVGRSHGNPFFLEEIVRALIDSGRLYQDGDVWRARPRASDPAVPESVQSVIQSRVDRLEPQARGVLVTAAVMGRVFRRRVLERVIGDAAVAERALWELMDRGLIYPERVVPEEEYSFNHVLTQQTIYDRLAPRQRMVLHQQAGKAIEGLYAGHVEEHAESLAYHYERSEADEKAVTYLLMAAEKARRAYLNEAAIGYFQRVLERLDGESGGWGRVGRPAHASASEGGAEQGAARKQASLSRPLADRRLAALRGLGQIHHGMGNQPDAAECFRQAIAIGQEIGSAPRDLVRLFYWLSEVLWWQGRHEEMIQIGEKGLALLGKETESIEAALMCAAIGEGCLHTGDEAKWREFTLRPAPALERLP